jgi:hypothetical protein
MWMIGFTDRPARCAWPLDNPAGKPDGRIRPRPTRFPTGIAHRLPGLHPHQNTDAAEGLALINEGIFLKTPLRAFFYQMSLEIIR